MERREEEVIMPPRPRLRDATIVVKVHRVRGKELVVSETCIQISDGLSA
jgi:hypothetical protein